MLPVFLCDLAAASAPVVAESASPAWVAELAHRVDVYGRLEGHFAFTDEGVDIQNGGSQFGLSIEQKITEKVAAFGLAEWSFNLGEGDKSYSISENQNSSFGTFDTTVDQAFGTRYGYFGVRFGPYGTLTLGKQSGVYYDISRWTDVYSVFGARGSSTFNAGTDGGQTGEGRANDAVTYRIPVGPVRLGAQAQFLDAREAALDSLSASLIVEPVKGLFIGAAYSRSFLDVDVELVGYDGGDAQALTGGIKLDRSGWKLAVVDTWTRNHEVVSTEAASVIYDTLGAELFAGRLFPNGFMPFVGFDFAIPRSLDTRYVDPDFGNRDLLGGLRYYFESRRVSFFYLEGRTGSSRDALGERAEDVVTLGMRLEFSMRRALGFEP
jgi:predicted porin